MKVKLTAVLLITCSIILLLSGCNEKIITYKTDIPVDKLCEVADSKISDSATMALMQPDYIKGMMNVDVMSFEEYAVKVQASGANVNEYGIFKAPSDDAVDGIVSMVKEYLAMRVDTWMPEYMPEEFPKVKEATCKVMGRYVVYCILSESERREVYTAIDNALLGK
jgi:hypothetical protein